MGFGWASNVTDRLARIGFILAVFGVPTAVIVLKHQPAWLIALAGTIAAFGIWGEGAYRAWAVQFYRAANAATAGRYRDPTAYANHMRDLQQFAHAAQDTILQKNRNGVDIELIAPIRLTDATREMLDGHAPALFRDLQEWNAVTEHDGRDYYALQVALDTEQERLGLPPSSDFKGALYQVTVGENTPTDMEWFVNQGNLTARGARNVSFQIAPLPSRHGEVNAFIQTIWYSITHISEVPEVAVYLKRTNTRKRLRPELQSALGRLELTHDFDSECPLCPARQSLVPSARAS